MHELVRGFGHPRANDRTDAANQGDASRANSELDSETERTASSPNQFMNQFASSPANVKGCVAAVEHAALD